MEKGIQPRAKMLVQFMMHVTNSRVNLLPLEIKDPGIQFMTGLKWFRIIVIQGCRIRSNEAKDQILSSLGWYGRGHLIMGKDFDTLCYASYGKYYYMTLNPKPIGFGVSPSFKSRRCRLKKMSRPHHAGCVVEASRELYVCGEIGSWRCLLSHVCMWWRSFWGHMLVFNHFGNS
ncbi:hypothetical protein ERO13_D07G036850v2 [Gossypium hirsutum]|nr:hypothetical protein ERO13_D07G036850v2 [Gossypium hirsutum]